MERLAPSPRACHRTLSPCPGTAHFTLQVPWQVALGDTSGSCLVTGPVCGPAGEVPGPQHLSSEGPQWLASQCTCFTRSRLWPGDKSMSVGGRPPLPGSSRAAWVRRARSAAQWPLFLLQVAGLCSPAAPGAAGLSLHPSGPGKAEQVAGDRVSPGALRVASAFPPTELWQEGHCPPSLIPQTSREVLGWASTCQDTRPREGRVGRAGSTGPEASKELQNPTENDITFALRIGQFLTSPDGRAHRAP